MFDIGNQPETMRATRRALFLVLVLALCQLQPAQAQFFTKSSKSIPRMGRRSGAQDSAASMSSVLFRRALIDRLVDEYGPNLWDAMQVSFWEFSVSSRVLNAPI